MKDFIGLAMIVVGWTVLCLDGIVLVYFMSTKGDKP